MSKISVKRTVLVKTVLSDGFRENLKLHTGKELETLDSQLVELELKIKQTHDNIHIFPGQFTPEAMQQAQAALFEQNQRFQQLMGYKQELIERCEEIVAKPDGEKVVTGILDNYVELSVGENIYQKMESAEIVVKDGVISEINL